MSVRRSLSGWFRRLFPKKTLGKRGEAAAARFLRRRGYKILARGDRFGPGELDLVALDGKTIVFVEVKTRESAVAGHPADAVDAVKQRRLTRLAVTLEPHETAGIMGFSWPVLPVVLPDSAFRYAAHRSAAMSSASWST